MVRRKDPDMRRRDLFGMLTMCAVAVAAASFSTAHAGVRRARGHPAEDIWLPGTEADIWGVRSRTITIE
jgi:hypothetical protein